MCLQFGGESIYKAVPRYYSNGVVAMLVEVTDAPYRRGQVWTYSTRPGEENSRVVVGRVDRLPDDHVVVHVAVVGVRIRNPHLESGYQTRIPHAPMSEAALTASLGDLTEEAADLEGFDEGYNFWLTSYEDAGGGYFTVPVSELPDLYERAFQGGAT
jgi:hypothetical protein